MSIDNVYNFSVQRQNSADLPPGKSPCVKIKFIKDESVSSQSLKFKIGNDSEESDPNTLISTPIDQEVKSEQKFKDFMTSPIAQVNTATHNIDHLWQLLCHLHEVISKKDVSGIFAKPVNEVHAPNYSTIISQPMDLGTIRLKIGEYVYINVAQMLNDIILMLHNALVYNDSETIYYRIATQILNFIKKTFLRENLNKLIQSKLWWPRALTDEEYGNTDECISKIRELLVKKPKERPNRIVNRNPDVEFFTKKKRINIDNVPNVKTRKRSTKDSENSFQRYKSGSSEVDGSCSFNNTQSEKSSSEEEESDDDVAKQVLIVAQQAARKAKEQLKCSKHRPVVYLEQRGEDICVVNTETGACSKVGEEMTTMIKSVKSVNLEKMFGDNEECSTQLNLLCYDSNECVTLTTSKPLQPYSFAEQAVLVETFGNVITAEYACNMHNYVLDLPQNSAAVELVKNRLNVATNYLTYGVDQIIIKKLKAANK